MQPSDEEIQAYYEAHAAEFMTPVIMLSDNYIANGAEPWKLPEMDELPDALFEESARRRVAAWPSWAPDRPA